MVTFETWRWKFYVFESEAEGCPVQRWFDSLPQDHRDEIVDLLDYVRNTTSKPWPEKVYDSLKGEGGISEIKVENIPCEREGELIEVTYRMYGFFGPKEYKYSYTFLHAWEKNVKNDRLGKQLAKGRLGELLRGGSGTGVRQFDFEGKSGPQTQEKSRRPN